MHMPAVTTVSVSPACSLSGALLCFRMALRSWLACWWWWIWEVRPHSQFGAHEWLSTTTLTYSLTGNVSPSSEGGIVGVTKFLGIALLSVLNYFLDEKQVFTLLMRDRSFSFIFVPDSYKFLVNSDLRGKGIMASTGRVSVVWMRVTQAGHVAL